MGSSEFRIPFTFEVAGKISDVQGGLMMRVLGNSFHNRDSVLPRQVTLFDQRPSTLRNLIQKGMRAPSEPLINEFKLSLSTGLRGARLSTDLMQHAESCIR